MAVGRSDFPDLPKVAGIALGTACAGIKQSVRDDLVVIELAADSACAAVFTQNAFCAAPVAVARANMAHGPRWLLINSGNANAGNGAEGLRDARETCACLAELTRGGSEQVLPFSTGVIGQALPVEKIRGALPKALAGLAENHWRQAAHAIMTTDTFAKGATRAIVVEGQSVTVNGIAKGAGMIHPDMATMLAFIGTDARIERTLLQQCLENAVEASFNRITVDGDTSTNDACVLMASGCSKAPAITRNSAGYELFAEAVAAVCRQLAEAIVRDGEGATKLMRIRVRAAASEREALEVGKTVAHSPLVKTAFFAADPNWGRILAAVGRAGLSDLKLEQVWIYLDDVCIVERGGRSRTYTEAAGRQVMGRPEITVTIRLGRGSAEAEVLTCDFSYDYVRINAEYRT